MGAFILEYVIHFTNSTLVAWKSQHWFAIIQLFLFSNRTIEDITSDNASFQFQVQTKNKGKRKQK